MGALAWNSATITALDRTQMDFGVMVYFPHSTLSSRVNLGFLAPFVPSSFPTDGSTPSDAGFAPLLSVGVIYQPEDSPFAFGVGLLTISGSSLNYPADPHNAALSPFLPFGVGFSSIEAIIDVLQVPLTVAAKVTDHLSIGVAPTPDVGLIVADPALFTAPDNASGSSFATYPSATHAKFAWGIGGQVGAYYTTDAGWNFGVSYKSPQVFEPFTYHARDQVGGPRDIAVRLAYPSITSVGIAYQGLPRWLFALDLRWIDYRHARFFGDAGVYSPDGAVQGFGWRSIGVVALGAQYQATDRISVRAGYSFNQNPVDPALTSINIGSPAVVEHTFSVGASYNITRALSVSATYSHGFQNSISGPAILPTGTLRFVQLTSQASSDSILLGATLQF
jgi:long-chain fatty acid transport protein